MVAEQLVLVVHPDTGKQFDDALRQEILRRNHHLPDFKRVHGVLAWERDFPRTASMKVKRNVLAEEIRAARDRSAMRPLEAAPAVAV